MTISRSTKTAIILPLELLNIHIDTHRFITAILIEAQKHNPHFHFKFTLSRQCLELAKSFNEGKIKPEMFSTTLLTLLDMADYPIEKFWEFWNKALTVDNHLADTLNDLKKFAADNHCLFYLIADINPPHFQHLQDQLMKLAVPVNPNHPATLLDTFPLYLSHTHKRSGTELIKVVLADIANKKMNKPDEIIMTVADAEKLPVGKQKEQAEADIAAIRLLLDSRKKILLHKNTGILQTLELALENVNKSEKEMNPTL